MKRQHKPKRYNEPPSIDPAKNLTGEQLRLIGAATIAWNYVERAHNLLFNDVVGVPIHLLQEITPRINGFDGVKAISIIAIERYLKLPSDVRTELKDTLDAAHECKTFRDALGSVDSYLNHSTIAAMVTTAR